MKVAEPIDKIIAAIRNNVNELEHLLTTKELEAARYIARSLTEEMDTIIDNIDEGLYV